MTFRPVKTGNARFLEDAEWNGLNSRDKIMGTIRALREENAVLREQRDNAVTEAAQLRYEVGILRGMLPVGNNAKMVADRPQEVATPEPARPAAAPPVVQPTPEKPAENSDDDARQRFSLLELD